MIDRPFYYNNTMDLELKGLKKDHVITFFETQSQKRFGVYMAVQAAAFIAISVLAAALAFVFKDQFKAIVLSVAGFAIGGGAALLHYNALFGLSWVRSEIQSKYVVGGEIALTDIEKVLSVATEETQEKLVSEMSFEQAVFARKFIDPKNFNKWVKGIDWSAVIHLDEEKIDEHAPIIEKNRWVLRAIEDKLTDKQKLYLQRKAFLKEESEVFGIVHLLNKLKEEFGSKEEISFPMPEIVRKFLSDDSFELNHDNIVELLKAADYLNSGELFLFLDEYIYSHINQFNQNDLIDFIRSFPDLVQVKSYFARQILSRSFNVENWREVWAIAKMIAPLELSTRFKEFLFANNLADFETLKEVMPLKEYSIYLNDSGRIPFEKLNAILKEEFENPTCYLEIYYDYFKKNYPDQVKLFASDIKLTNQNVKVLIKISDFKKLAETYINLNWKNLVEDKIFSVDELLERLSYREKEIFAYLKDNHQALIEKKVITETAWKSYEFIYFTKL